MQRIIMVYINQLINLLILLIYCFKCKTNMDGWMQVEIYCILNANKFADKTELFFNYIAHTQIKKIFV